MRHDCSPNGHPMFDRLKKVLGKDSKAVKPSATVPAASAAALDPVSEWAATQGFHFSSQPAGAAFAVQGRVGGKPWRMEVGRPSRKYIRGDELRGRAELGLDPQVLVVLMNRPLKDALEKQAYALYTDTLQTSIDPNLPEEMRLLAMYEETGWDSIPRPFWSRYSVVSDDRANALAWLDPLLAQQLMEWPAPAPAADVPFMLLLLRGKVYLRMQASAGHMPALQHAAAIFTTACENALGAFGTGSA
ncbi:hypothetical protein [Ramlibacter pinisoli]|nr:hypothetical protein [Ramlibacter sp. CGMCC 1.13660]